jgi:signal transduction histidine kinase
VVWNGVILDATRMKQAEIAAAQARDEAQAANRTKSEFLANMSHELRTPLNAIIGFSELMRTAKFGPLGNERYKEYSEIIHDSGKHLLAIINDILDLSKVEAGEMTLREEEVDLAEVCASCERLVAGRAADGNVAVTFAPLADAPALWADKTKVKQMLLNLLSNAIKFTLPGATVDVRVTPRGDGGIDLSVADTGIGIAKENIPLVLRPFRQVENVYSRSHEGTGLGLPLVKALIELHGGALTLDSELGKGTVASLHFPPARVRRPEAGKPARRGKTSAA